VEKRCQGSTSSSGSAWPRLNLNMCDEFSMMGTQPNIMLGT
jgi:hypothetical protein